MPGQLRPRARLFPRARVHALYVFLADCSLRCHLLDIGHSVFFGAWPAERRHCAPASMAWVHKYEHRPPDMLPRVAAPPHSATAPARETVASHKELKKDAEMASGKVLW